MPIACDICGRIYSDKTKMKKFKVASLPEYDGLKLLAGYFYVCPKCYKKHWIKLKRFEEL